MKYNTLNPHSNCREETRDGNPFEKIRRPRGTGKPDSFLWQEHCSASNPCIDCEKHFLELVEELINEKRLPSNIVSARKATRNQVERRLTNVLLKINYAFVSEPHFLKLQVRRSTSSVLAFKRSYPDRCGGDKELRNLIELANGLYDIYTIAINDIVDSESLVTYLSRICKIEEMRLRLVRRHEEPIPALSN